MIQRLQFGSAYLKLLSFVRKPRRFDLSEFDLILIRVPKWSLVPYYCLEQTLFCFWSFWSANPANVCREVTVDASSRISSRCLGKWVALKSLSHKFWILKLNHFTEGQRWMSESWIYKWSSVQRWVLGLCLKVESKTKPISYGLGVIINSNTILTTGKWIKWQSLSPWQRI